MNFSPSCTSSKKVNKVRRGTVSLCRAASPSQTASSRDAFWPPHCSPSSSASCSMRQEDLPDGIYIRFRTDGSLFNLRRLLVRTKTIKELITELLFADDCALLAHISSDAAKNVGLTISLKKTEVLYHPPPREAYSPSHISIDGTNLNAVEHFTYLCSVISNDATVSKDLDNRLSKASSSFGRLSKRVWQSHSLRLSTKIQVYRAVVVPTLLNGAETWVPYRKQIRQLERFHQRCLRSILGKTTCQTKKSSREPACPA